MFSNCTGLYVQDTDTMDKVLGILSKLGLEKIDQQYRTRKDVELTYCVCYRELGLMKIGRAKIECNKLPQVFLQYKASIYR